MTITKRLFLVSVSLLVLALFTGCGDTEQKTATPKKESNKTLEQIKQRGKLLVATEAALAPFEFVEDGKIVGYGADILQEIVKDMGVELDQKDMSFAGILTGLQEKKYDLVATAITVTPERKEKFGLTTPIADGSLYVLKRIEDDSIKTIDDLSGKAMGAPVNSASEKNLKDFSKKLKEKGADPIKEIRLYNSVPETALELKYGKIDAIVQPLPIANVLIKENPGTFEKVGIILDNQYVSWAVRTEDTDLLDYLNKKIIDMKKSGKLAELQQKWFGNTFDLPDQLP